MKVLFDLITSPFSLFENPIYNYFIMFFIGLIALLILNWYANRNKNSLLNKQLFNKQEKE